MSQNSSSSANSFSQLHIFGFSKFNESADWFLMTNSLIPPVGRGDKHFDQNRPNGKHPLLVLDTDFNELSARSRVTSFIRSSVKEEKHSSSKKLRHPAHDHISHEPNSSCKLNKDGLFLGITSVISGQYFDHWFCKEPLDSEVLPKLRRLK
jgi:hypothetical protein